MIAELRTYFDDRIKAVDGAYSFIDDPFGDDTISERYGDSNYKLWFGEISREVNQNYFTDSLTANIEIYSEECRDNTTAFDTIYDKGVNIADHVMDPVCLETLNESTYIWLETITPSPVEGNDKMVKITLSFNIRKDRKYC